MENCNRRRGMVQEWRCRDGLSGPDGMAISIAFLCDAMEQLPARCAFGDQSFVLFIGRDMELASIHTRVSERLGINMKENILRYLVPIDGQVDQVLLDDGDVQAMFDLHKCQRASLINLQIHAVDTRCLSTHASRQSGDPPPLDRVLAEGQIGVNIRRRRCCVGVNPMDANTKSSVQ
ncbi:hypothetical protein Taro_053334 [Colocasia esculenta]|uniref:PB1 domain-containing protein n=1 Tax=Colocasia esculenta TaxID=4460 RepID=A0A843XLW1_COLES|nr:hypothetical protein [Colocasia esculenta]